MSILAKIRPSLGVLLQWGSKTSNRVHNAATFDVCQSSCRLRECRQVPEVNLIESDLSAYRMMQNHSERSHQRYRADCDVQ